MRFLVISRTRETIVGDMIPAAQQKIGTEMQRVLSSGKVTDTGVFVGARAGFMLVNVNSAEELFELTASLLDEFEMEVHPLVSMEVLGQFFQQQADSRGT
jgi:hypothetical protein